MRLTWLAPDGSVTQSLLRFTELITGNPGPFALTYSCGNILSIAGTSFIVGPCNQMKKMFKNHRWMASLVYLVSIGVTIFCCLYRGWDKPNGDDEMRPPAWVPLIIIVAVVTQFFALIWSASLSPPSSVSPCCRRSALFLLANLAARCRYIFTYIPFARTCVTRCLKNCGTSCAEF